MSISVGALRESVDALTPLDGVDPARLSGEEATAWVARVARLRHAADAVLAELAQRIDHLSEPETGRFARTKGFAGSGALVAEVAQVSQADASKLISIGHAMPGPGGAGFPHVAAAVRAGDLGLDKATVIRKTLSDLADVPAGLERTLVARALRLPFAAVRRMCFQEFSRLDQAALEERERRQRAARYVRWFDEPDGMLGLHARLDAVTAAPLRAWLDAEVRRGLNDQRGESLEEQRDAGQIGADALGALARHVLGCEGEASGVKTTLVVHVTKEELESGVGTARCDGIEQPVSISTLRALAVDAAVLPVVMGGESLPLDLGRARRLFSPAQRQAIAARDGGCAKCGAPVARCDVHHIRWWSRGGGTDIDNGVLLCVGCHHRVHDYGWEIVVERGQVWFVPPASIDPGRRRQPGSSARLVAA